MSATVASGQVNQSKSIFPSIVRPIDRESLRAAVRSAKPFPYFCIDNFLAADFANEVEAAFPGFAAAEQMGRKFDAVNEKNKVQITDSSKFPPAIKRLHDALSSAEWLSFVSYVMDIPRLQADPKLVGGGIHQTGPRGHLDVHVDFNYLGELDLHRRLNILVYFNKGWKPEWGGAIELWDKDVKVREHAFEPLFNRCVIFETNDISYHGVSAVKCPPGVSRRSFAAYYYTAEAPAGWTGEKHSTIFKARPNERLKGGLLMPAEKVGRQIRWKVIELLRRIKHGGKSH